MCTIIKVKRKITDDPVDCLIIECKKKKIFIDHTADSLQPKLETHEEEKETLKDDESNELNGPKIFRFNEDRIDSIKQVLKYAGSAKSENEISAKLIEISSKYRGFSFSNKKDLKSNFPSNKDLSNQINKSIESKKEIKSNRYVLLNKKRGIENETPTVSSKRTQARTNLNDVNIIDVISSDYIANETEIESSPAKAQRLTCNGVEMIREKCATNTVSKKTKETNSQIEFDSKTNEYVYDIYYTKNMDIHLDLLYPNNFEIKSASFGENIELLDDNYVEDPADLYEDDEDSNEEGNWRNDYPDEDEDDDIDNEEDDDVYAVRNGYAKHETYDDYDDNYNEYGYGNDQDEDVDNKLTHYMKKSCNLDGSFYGDDSENDDYDEYDNETSKSYSAYKRKLIKDLDN